MDTVPTQMGNLTSRWGTLGARLTHPPPSPAALSHPLTDQIPWVNVEQGLRTGDSLFPFGPEEANRKNSPDLWPRCISRLLLKRVIILYLTRRGRNGIAMPMSTGTRP